MIILASSSPRRAELLRAAGVAFETVVVSDAVEQRYDREWSGLSPLRLCRRLAFLKALVASRQVSRPALIIGADTIAELDGEALGKACDRAEAGQMLRRMCGRDHEVITGLAVFCSRSGRVIVDSVSSTVRLGAVDAELIDDYIASGLADNKAGAYGIQDPLIAPLIAEVRGPRDNVIGLPVTRLLEIIEELRA